MKHVDNIEIKQLDIPPAVAESLDNLHKYLQMCLVNKNEDGRKWATEEITKIHQIFLTNQIVVKDVDKNGGDE